MPIAADYDEVGILRDRCIYLSPRDVRVFSAGGLCAGVARRKRIRGSRQQLDLVICYWQAIEDRRKSVA